MTDRRACFPCPRADPVKTFNYSGISVHVLLFLIFYRDDDAPVVLPSFLIPVGSDMVLFSEACSLYAACVDSGLLDDLLDLLGPFIRCLEVLACSSVAVGVGIDLQPCNGLVLLKVFSNPAELVLGRRRQVPGIPFIGKDGKGNVLEAERQKIVHASEEILIGLLVPYRRHREVNTVVLEIPVMIGEYHRPAALKIRRYIPRCLLVNLAAEVLVVFQDADFLVRYPGRNTGDLERTVTFCILAAFLFGRSSIRRFWTPPAFETNLISP